MKAKSLLPLAETCRNCSAAIIKEKMHDPFFHVDSGDEKCEGRNAVALPRIAEATRLRSLVLGFLRQYELIGDGVDTHIYSKKEWKERGEEYCGNSPFVLTFEGPLYRVMNPAYGDERDHRIEGEFLRLLQDYGWYWELGYAWCAGFYRR